nr:hypothetical protein [Tanacetum cinerariifolium]
MLIALRRSGDEKNDETDYKRLQFKTSHAFHIVDDECSRYKPKLRSYTEYKSSAAPLAALTIMKETLTVKDEEPLNSARDVRKVMQANYHSCCGQRSYFKERNCLDDVAFANTDMSSGTCTYIASRIVDATTRLTSHYHHRDVRNTSWIVGLEVVDALKSGQQNHTTKETLSSQCNMLLISCLVVTMLK